MMTEYGKRNDNIIGASYIGAPRDYTVMYVSKKVEQLIQCLEKAEGCLIFAEEGIKVPKRYAEKNDFIFTDNPQRDYAEYMQKFLARRQQQDRRRSYVLAEGGYYLGENVMIGEGTYIEPGCLIGHDVVIGKNAYIMTGVKIKNAVIGDDFIANENAVIGAYGFTVAEGMDGNKLRIPTLGKVIIGDHVEVGACDNISVGTSGDTVIEDYVKLDALVHIGHDARIKKNVEIAAGAIIGGFDVIGEGTFIGINACIRNRITMGTGSMIGMGATVVKGVDSKQTVVGNPARPMVK